MTPQQVESLQQEYMALKQENEDLKQQVKLLLEQLRLARHKRFGASSERSDANQLRLFNEAELEAEPTAEEPTVETITYERRKKQAGHREALLKDLPVERIEYRLSEEEQVCLCCGGRLLFSPVIELDNLPNP